MIVQIGLEILFVLLIFFLATNWWQLRKRPAFLKRAVNDDEVLSRIITRQTLSNPPADAAVYAKKNPVGYFLNIAVLVDADKLSQRRPAILISLLCVGLFIASYYLGLAYLGINLGVFFLLAFAPITDAAKSNALQHIYQVAYILHIWRYENPVECDEWVARAVALRKLYDAVKRAS